MNDWIVDLDNNTCHHFRHNITLEFRKVDGEWKGLLGPTSFEGTMPLRDFAPILKEGDDAFRTAKGLPLQPWDFLDEEDEF